MKTMQNAIMLLFLLAPLVAVSTIPVNAVEPYNRTDRERLIDSHRQMFAMGELSQLDKGMNDLQQKFENGEWSESNIRHFFSRPFPGSRAFEDVYNKWATTHPKSYVARYLRGRFFANLALKRIYSAGGIENCTPEELAEIKPDLDIAIKDLSAATGLTARPELPYAVLIEIYGATGALDHSREILGYANKKVPNAAAPRSQYMTELVRAGGNTDEMRRVMKDVRNSKMTAMHMNNITGIYVAYLLKSGLYDELDRHANLIQQDYEDGKISDTELRDAFCKFTCTTEPDLEKKFDGWVNSFPNSYAARQSRSFYYFNLAVKARGGQLMKDTSEGEVTGMRFFMEKALDDARVAVTLTDKPFLSYKGIFEIGRFQGWSQKYMDDLLERSISIDPDNFLVRYEYMTASQERWGGSFEKMQAFMKDVRAAGLPTYQMYWFEGQIQMEKFWNDFRTHDDIEDFGQLQTGF